MTDLALIKNFLKKKFESVNDLQVLNSGAWSAAYKFTAMNKSFVLRISSTIQNFNKDKLSQKLVGNLLPVPEIISIDEVGDEFLCISEYVDGVHFETQKANSLKAMKKSIVGIFEGLFRVDLSDTTGFGNWNEQLKGTRASWKEFILGVDQDDDIEENIIHGWKDNLLRSDFDGKDFEQIVGKLNTLANYLPETRNLIHSDLLNYNVLSKKEKIVAVIDWGSSKFGDYLYDLAWFEFYEPWYPEFTKIRLNEEIRDLLFNIDSSSFKNERVLAYKMHIGLDSIAYNSFKEDWQNVRIAYDRVIDILEGVEQF